MDSSQDRSAQFSGTVSTKYPGLITFIRPGVPRHELSYGRKDHPLKIIKNLRNLKPSAEFRHAWQYNNMMYTTASYLPELFANMSIMEYTQEHILDPLRMTSTFYDVKKARDTGHLSDGFYCDGLDMRACYEDMVPKLANATEGQDVAINPLCLGKQEAIGWWLQPGEEAGIAGAGGIISRWVAKSTPDVSTS
jgi:CubicO group peptidase (beta-lactamase class C family)